MDKPDQRADEVLNETFDLFVSLDASEEQLDFPVIYASGRSGWADKEINGSRENLNPLLNLIIEHVKPSDFDRTKPFAMLSTLLYADSYLGRSLVGRISQGTAKANQQIKAINLNGEKVDEGRLTKIFRYEGTKKVPIEIGEAGDIVIVAGLEKANVADTICDLEINEPIKATPIDPPTMSIKVTVNSSPLAGTEGKKLTSTQIRERLIQESENNVGISFSENESKDAFEISGNTVTYNVELFENGYAGPPEMIDLHDVVNDQGRQMRAVWHAGMPGSWNYFTQFSIWRKVNNAPVDLWDYIETVPWHGMDPYAAVVPTLGDSSAHGIHMSTFMVTAHTEDVSFWIDSEPMSGYSIDNLHPSVPMGLAFSTSPGSVSLNWSGPVEEDFSYFNVYRQDILTNEPAVVFTTTDSFYVDQELSDVGAYEYWITAVDMSGLESDASSIVSAVLSAEEKMGMPTEFALKQNYPNPFNPSTQIQYALPSETRVLISIYDLTGRKVRTLVNEVQSAGHRSVMWNATNEIGRPVSAGMYIYTIQAGDFIQNRKMVLLK